MREPPLIVIDTILLIFIFLFYLYIYLPDTQESDEGAST